VTKIYLVVDMALLMRRMLRNRRVGRAGGVQARKPAVSVLAVVPRARILWHIGAVFSNASGQESPSPPSSDEALRSRNHPSPVGPPGTPVRDGRGACHKGLLLYLSPCEAAGRVAAGPSPGFRGRGGRRPGWGPYFNGVATDLQPICNGHQTYVTQPRASFTRGMPPNRHPVWREEGRMCYNKGVGTRRVQYQQSRTINQGE